MSAFCVCANHKSQQVIPFVVTFQIPGKEKYIYLKDEQF